MEIKEIRTIAEAKIKSTPAGCGAGGDEPDKPPC